MEENAKSNIANPYLIPLAIVIAGGLIAGAVFMNGGNSGNVPITNNGNNQPTQAAPQPSGSTDDVRSITAEDHIKGDPNAPVKIVEYSDFECPFCKRFHDTMNQVMASELGTSGEVAWVYRHFPLDQLHPVKARAEAVASECAAELGGNDAFWQFADRFMEITPSNNRTEIETVIPQIVREIGLDETAFQTCFESGKYDEHIQDDVDNAIATGGRGTPWSIVVAPNGKTFPLNGAQPLAAVQQLIGLASQEQ
ncbi:disulfide bond formation protein DsbA [bacterium]|nr:disulfide bond formation protein DsbA [bacterium]|tara:strand:+ start:1974 stop:2729 length:756 start_codon:yes stop_codon:yes gene_type:complete